MSPHDASTAPSFDGDKRRASALSLVYNIVLATVKLAAALVTGSVSLMSEAAHSTTDVLSSLVAFVSVRAAAAPPDEEHPYGHGKIESLSAFAEAILLSLVVGYVGIHAAERLLSGTSQVHHVDWGLGVMLLSTGSSLIVGRYVAAIARRTGSPALRSNAAHVMVDFWTSAGVLAALLVTTLTDWAQADSVMALGLSLWLVVNALRMGRDAFEQLIDRRLPPEDVKRIRDIVDAAPDVMGHHALRTRLSGSVRYADLHIVVPNDWSVVQAHALADELEEQIEAALSPAQVVIHVDPFDPAKVEARARLSGR